MDTRRHVSIAQLTSVAMLGLLGRHVGWQGNSHSQDVAQIKGQDKNEQNTVQTPKQEQEQSMDIGMGL
jgi:hypothetical protein